MNRRLWALLLLASALLLAACGGGEGDNGGSGGDGGSVESVTQRFIDALFAGNFDEAKTMAAAGFEDTVNEKVDAFEQLSETYEFREISINTTRAWRDGSGDEESDKRVEITYQFREQQPDARWMIGSVNVRALIDEDGSWSIANLLLIRPEE